MRRKNGAAKEPASGQPGAAAPQPITAFTEDAQAQLQAEVKHHVDALHQLLDSYAPPPPTAAGEAAYLKYGQDVTAFGTATSKMVEGCAAPFAALEEGPATIQARTGYVEVMDTARDDLQKLSQKASGLSYAGRVALAVMVDTCVKVRDCTIDNPATDPTLAGDLDRASRDLQGLRDKRAADRQTAAEKTRSMKRAEKEAAAAKTAEAQAQAKAQAATAKAQVAESAIDTLRLKLQSQLLSDPAAAQLHSEPPPPAPKERRTPRGPRR